MRPDPTPTAADNVHAFPGEGDTELHTLPNGVRVVVLQLPHARTAAVSAYLRSGSAHESPALSGIGHVVEHMVFKGTATRDAARINLDAESLGAEVNAHTDKDHSAFHLHGLPADAGRFVAQLADLLLEPTFPADELERERQVLLQEFSEDEDDPMAEAYRLFDRAAFGLHPLAQPAIGRRANVERFTRADLVGWMQRQISGHNLVLAAAGPLDPGRFVREVEAAFGALAAGTPHRVTPPAWRGGLRSKRLDSGSQAHLVMGYPCAPRGDDDALGELAAVLFGEGMSAPLMAELRERRGLVYYAGCAADVLEPSGQWVVEASFAPAQIDQVLAAVAQLLRSQADHVATDALQRARRQLVVKLLRDQDRATRRLESAALDVLALNRVRSTAERQARLDAIDAGALRQAFAQMLDTVPAVALAGSLPRGVGERARTALAALPTPLPRPRKPAAG